MDRSLIKTLMPSLVMGHVPWRWVDRSAVCSMVSRSLQRWASPSIPSLSTARWSPRRTMPSSSLKPSEFAVLDFNLEQPPFSEGAKVHVQPYARHRFDGLRADTPEVSAEGAGSARAYTITRHILGSAPAKLPIPGACMELGQLIEQLEEMPAPDGFRRITHMLVDAGAHGTSPGSIPGRRRSSRTP